MFLYKVMSWLNLVGVRVRYMVKIEPSDALSMNCFSFIAEEMESQNT